MLESSSRSALIVRERNPALENVPQGFLALDPLNVTALREVDET